MGKIRNGLSVLFIFAALCLLSCALFSCERNEAALPVLISPEEFSSYQIVRPDYGTSAEVKCGSALKKAFDSAGYILELKDDFFREDVEQFAVKEHEILIGHTNRPESEEFLNRLQPWQYGYSAVNGKIVIAGHSDDTLKLAVDEFISRILSRDSITYIEGDEYIHGSVKKGRGKVYTLLNFDADFSSGIDYKAESDYGTVFEKFKSAVSEKLPDVIIAQCASRDISDRLCEIAADIYDKYTVGADFDMAYGKCGLILYKSDAYSFSSAKHCYMTYQLHTVPSERGEFVYCVLRCRESMQKFVFCSLDLRSLSENTQASRIGTLADFAENCDKLPVIAGGSFSGEETENVLYNAGQMDFSRLACTPIDGDTHIYGTYSRLVPASVELIEEGQVYCEYQIAE